MPEIDWAARAADLERLAALAAAGKKLSDGLNVDALAGDLVFELLARQELHDYSAELHGYLFPRLRAVITRWRDEDLAARLGMLAADTTTDTDADDDPGIRLGGVFPNDEVSLRLFDGVEVRWTVAEVRSSKDDEPEEVTVLLTRPCMELRIGWDQFVLAYCGHFHDESALESAPATAA